MPCAVSTSGRAGTNLTCGFCVQSGGVRMVRVQAATAPVLGEAPRGDTSGAVVLIEVRQGWLVGRMGQVARVHGSQEAELTMLCLQDVRVSAGINDLITDAVGRIELGVRRLTCCTSQPQLCPRPRSGFQ